MSGLDAIIEGPRDPRTACAALVDYIEVYVSRGRRDITDEFYQKAPRILTKLLGSGSTAGWVEQLAGKVASVGELGSVYDLLAPKSTQGGQNLFSLLMVPPVDVRPYTVPISIFPPLTQHLIGSKNYHLLSPYFHNLSEKPDRQREYLDEGRIALYPHEYYLTVFLYAIKEQSTGTYFCSLLEFERSAQISGGRKDLQTGELIAELLAHNPLLMLFTQYLASFVAQSRSNNAPISPLDFFFMAVDELWLSEVYNAEKLQPAGSVQKVPDADSRPNSVGSSGPLVLDCLYVLFCCMQHRMAFPSLETHKTTGADYSSRVDSSLFDNMKHTFYMYLRQTFRGWHESVVRSIVPLHTVASLWLFFIKPWEFSPFLEEIFYNFEWSEYYPSDVGLMATPNPTHTQAAFADNIAVWTEVVMTNLLFYTDLFASL